MQNVTIQLVTWNSAKALSDSLELLKQIDSSQVVIRVIDNASHDDSIDLVRRFLPAADIVRLTTNRGFAGGHNEGFKRCTTPFVLVLNPDTQLEWSGIVAALRVFADKKVGAVQGKLYRTSDKIIDSVGVTLTTALNGREEGAGERDAGQYDSVLARDAISGACALYRLSALHSVMHANSEIFDEDFFAYKEDVDLGWRLTRAGWTVLYVPNVVGIHARSLRSESRLGWKPTLSGIWRRLRDRRTAYSLRSWLWMMAKNASLRQLFMHSPAIFGRAVVLLGFSLVYWPLLRAWGEGLAGLPRMIAKRQKSS